MLEPNRRTRFLCLCFSTAKDSTSISYRKCKSLGIRLQRANARAILSRVSAAAAANRNNTALAATSRSEAALVLSAALEASG